MGGKLSACSVLQLPPSQLSLAHTAPLALGASPRSPCSSPPFPPVFLLSTSPPHPPPLQPRGTPPGLPARGAACPQAPHRQAGGAAAPDQQPAVPP
jgi:hypothetical protein